MANSNPLQAIQITDKNGKRTTVHKKVEGAPTGLKLPVKLTKREAVAPAPTVADAFEAHRAELEAMAAEPTYDANGFDESGFHRETGSLFDEDGWDRNGYDEDDFNRKGYYRGEIPSTAEPEPEPEPAPQIQTHAEFVRAVDHRNPSEPLPEYPLGELSKLTSSDLRDLLATYEYADGLNAAELPEAIGYHIAGQRNGNTLSALWGSECFNDLSERSIRRLWENTSLHSDRYANDGYLAIAQATNTPTDVLEAVKACSNYSDVKEAAQKAIDAKAGA
jgi:hypothetical protein